MDHLMVLMKYTPPPLTEALNYNRNVDTDVSDNHFDRMYIKGNG